MALILEVLNGRGAVRTRVRLDALPLRLGRALDNDLILDDAYVDPRHAVIRRDAADDIIIEDLITVNGITRVAGGERVGRLTIAPGMELRLGRTLLRFRDSAELVAPALRDAPPPPRLLPRWAATTRGQMVFSLLAIAALALSSWLDSYERSAAEDAFLAALVLATTGGVWAGIWAVAGRVVVHRFRFFAHFALITLVMLLGFVLAFINDWTVFLFPDNSLTPLVGAIIAVMLVALLVAGHLAFASTLSRRRRWLMGAVASLVLLALGGVGAVIADEPFSDVPVFAGTVKAVRGNWLRTHTVAEFGAATLKLQQEVDALLER